MGTDAPRTLEKKVLAGADVAAYGQSDAVDLRGRQTCSVVEAARMLGIARATAYKAAHDGTLPVLHISNRILVSVPRLLALIGFESEQGADRRDAGSPTGESES